MACPPTPTRPSPPSPVSMDTAFSNMTIGQYVRRISTLPFTRDLQAQASYELQSEVTKNAKQSLLQFLYKDSVNTPNSLDQSSTYWAFYLSLVETRFNKLPLEFSDVRGSAICTPQFTFSDFCTIAGRICQLLSTEKCCSLDVIIADLGDKELITNDEQLSKKAQQFVFAIFGIISSLYMPTNSWQSNLLTIDVPLPRLNPRRASDTWAVTKQPIDDTNGTLVNILRNFGTTRGPIFYQEESSTPLDEINMLASSNLHYYTLSKLGGIKLEWVDSICMHLELNRRDKTLMIYKYPSVCALLSQNSRDGIFLDLLFKDYIEETNKKSIKRSPAGDFFREVLLTYRLLFGQDKRSWKLCRTEGDISKASNDTDPMLYRVCCQDWESEAIYDEIQAPGARSVHSARQDFSFFGERLIILQEYTRMLEPDTWSALYYDRRNMSRFATIWAAIFFGLATLLLTLFGLGLGAAQVAGTFN